ncbi:hypothetical protein SESBI_00835 [Sesbania bispinosa]|nr:hypothetical protein SESBI_00835 [Sesbania bispinosa]
MCATQTLLQDGEWRFAIADGLLTSLHGQRASTTNKDELQQWFCKVARSFSDCEVLRWFLKTSAVARLQGSAMVSHSFSSCKVVSFSDCKIARFYSGFSQLQRLQGCSLL